MPTTTLPSKREKPALPLPVVYVVDDDPDVRRSVAFLVSILDVEVRALATAEAFLEAWRPGDVGCLILDVRMPGMSGLELQEQMQRLGIDLPIIFVSGHGDIPMAVRAMRGGAVDFLTKPYSDQDLLDLIQRALQTHRDSQQRRREAATVNARFALLTQREAEVMALAVEGATNKQIAGELGISIKTVETHRARLMEKMRVENIAELCRANQLLQSIRNGVSG
ncbi:MAG: response regulator [Rhodocyclaceae bacterium]|nr:response regulator [Rhodocyclaceae bacterium]